MNKNYAFIFIICIIFFFQSYRLSGQDRDIPGPLSPTDNFTNTFGLFDNDELLEITLRFDITYFMANKPEDEFLDALLTYHYNRDDSVNAEIRLKSRGNFRYRTCDLTPILINLKKTVTAYEDLDSIKNLKMVTHCIDTGDYEKYILKEYLVYRLYNIVSDFSFKVRLLRVNYVDIGARKLKFTNYAFVIEPVKLLLNRTGTTEIEDINAEFQDIEDDNLSRMALFQYMIGNTDWFLHSIHNFKLLKRQHGESGKMITVPYDFDYCGFVNAHYAVPDVGMGLETIMDRVYIGPCRDEAVFRDLIIDFMQHRNEIISMIRDFKYLDNATRKSLIRYMDDFFKLEKKDELLSILRSNCIN